MSFLLICLILVFTFSIMFIVKYNNKNNDNINYQKNILLNIGLLALSGIVYILYRNNFNVMYMTKWPAFFLELLIIMFYILSLNLIGILFSIKYSKRIYITIMNYILFIISTVLTFYLLSSNIKFMEKIRINLGHLFIVFYLILENILTYLIVKGTIKIDNKIRGNCI